MLYNKNSSPLTDELFENPTSEYRAAPFWAWNCELNDKLIHKEIGCMKDMGFGGFHMHVRVGLTVKYLSDAFMDLIKEGVKTAKDKSMLAWLYDEDKWPSGFAGGYVTQKIENRAKYIIFTRKPYGCGAEEINDSSARASRGENGTLLAKYNVELDNNGCLKNYKRLSENEDGSNVWYAYLETQSPSPWFNNQSYVDCMSKSAIQDFINITHERYKQCIGNDFGKIVPAIFTDEPQITRKKPLGRADDTNDAIIPFTTDFADTFKAAYGDDILDSLPEIFWELPNGVSVARYHYHDHVAQRFAEAYADTIGEWCSKNNIMLTGHMMEEPTLESQNCAIGDCMRSYRGFQLPGIDMLCDSRELTTAKQAQSASHQYGREGVLSELYGVTNWDFDFRGHKLQGDWQAALGITVRVPHLYWASMKGEAKRDYPACIGHQSPWYKEYKYVENHFARVNTAMTRGKAIEKVGVIHPIESYWLAFGPDEQTADLKAELDEKFSSLNKWLLLGLIDFDYICEANLPAQAHDCGNKFGVGKMEYDTIIVADSLTLRSSTLALLKKFRDNGGRVIFCGDAPKYVDALPTDEVKNFAKQCCKVEFGRTPILSALENDRLVDIRNEKGRRSDNFIYQMRQDGENRWLFISNVYRLNNDYLDVKNNYTIALKGEYAPELYNTLTGEIEPLAAEYKNGKTFIKRTIYCQDSLLLKLVPGKSTVEEKDEADVEFIGYLDDNADIELDEPNVCLLDMPEYSLDGGEWRKSEEILRICDTLKSELHLKNEISKGAQPWIFEEKDDSSHKVSLRYIINSNVDVENVSLALEDFEKTQLIFNDKEVKMKSTGEYVDSSINKVDLGKLNKGKNVLILNRPFGKISTMESCYLLGDFGVEVGGRNVTIIEPVRSLSFGTWINQGLPFYGGDVTYKCKIQGGSRLKLRIPHFRQPVIAVSLDGKRCGTVAFAPFSVDLGYVADGEHELEIKAYGNRMNTFGSLHSVDFACKWYGPDGWRKKGDRWAYEYNLSNSGIIAAPMLLKY